MHLWVVTQPLCPGGVYTVLSEHEHVSRRVLVKMLTEAWQGQTCMRYCSSDTVMEMPPIQPGSYSPVSSLIGPQSVPFLFIF